MLKTEKERIVAELAAELESAATLIVTDYRGLTNKQLEALRDRLLEHGASFRIVKNTLTRRAAEQAGAGALLVLLEGPTAIAFVESGGDPAAVAKALAATAKETDVLVMRGGIFEGEALSQDQVAELATLPPFDVLRGQLVGAIVAPATQLLALLTAPLQDLRGVIEARIEQLGGSAGAEPPGPEGSAAPEADAPEEDGSPGAETEATADAADTAAPAPAEDSASALADPASAELAGEEDAQDAAPHAPEASTEGSESDLGVSAAAGTPDNQEDE